MIQQEVGYAPFNRYLSRPNGIRFGNYLFSDPVPLGSLVLPATFHGVYVLLMPDPTWIPCHFQPVFFGEFGGGHQSQISPAEQLRCFRVAAGRTLYVAFHTLPPERALERSRMRCELINRYTPVCNLGFNNGPIEARLQALERRVNEQETLLKVALAAIGQATPIQPEPAKRPVGFRPDPAGSGRSRTPGEATEAGK